MVRVTPVIPMLDPIIHTEARPFCDDKSCPCHADRFLTADLGYHHAESDQELPSLRLPWNGDQTCLDHLACLRLWVLLPEVFPDYSVECQALRCAFPYLQPFTFVASLASVVAL